MSELNVIDSSIKLFSIDKKVITFKINRDEKNITDININASTLSQQRITLGKTSLTVTNLTSEYISLRTKTTKKKNYLVNPSYCNIKPNSQQKLDLIYFVKIGEIVSNEGHKFKFEGFIISPEENEQDSRLLFNKYISQKIPVKAYLIKAYVEFIQKEMDKDNDGDSFNINNLNNMNNGSNNNVNNETNNNINDNIQKLTNQSINNRIINNNNEMNNNNSNSNDNMNNNIRDNISQKKNDSIDNNSFNNSINNNTKNINNINNITEEKIKENENNNIINEEEEENNINTKENNNYKSEKNSNKNSANKPSNKTLSLNINNSLVNKNESKDNNVTKTQKKTKFDFNSVKDFESPKKKKFMHSSMKNDEFEKPRTEEENNALLNNLKVEYYKLKNELDNLIERYYNLRNHVDLEEDNRDLNSEQSLKNNYSKDTKKEIKLPQHICIGLFIFAVMLGFYLS